MSTAVAHVEERQRHDQANCCWARRPRPQPDDAFGSRRPDRLRAGFQGVQQRTAMGVLCPTALMQTFAAIRESTADRSPRRVCRRRDRCMPASMPGTGRGKGSRSRLNHSLTFRTEWERAAARHTRTMELTWSKQQDKLGSIRRRRTCGSSGGYIKSDGQGQSSLGERSSRNRNARRLMAHDTVPYSAVLVRVRLDVGTPGIRMNQRRGVRGYGYGPLPAERERGVD